MLRLMTFNILVDKPGSPFPWPERRGLVAAAIEAEDPDILCIQEALEHQRTYLEDALPGYAAFGVGRNDGGQAGEQTAIFHKTAALRKLKQGVFWLSETPTVAGSIGWDAKRPRTVTWKLLEAGDGGRFYVLNTHFDHRGLDANVHSARVIADWRASQQDAHPVLLCGDFNSPPEGSQAFDALLDCGFSDAYGTAGEQYLYTYHKFQVEAYSDPALRAEILADHPRVFRRIDHVFVSGALSISSIRTQGADDKGQYPSDHFPVMCDFELGHR